MALQFSLLGSPDALARSAQPPLVDVAGAIEAGYTMAGNISAAQEKLRQQREADQDRRILQEGLKTGKLDLFTPKGIEQALVQLRGQVSPGFYMKLGEQAQAAKKADLAFQKSLADMDATALTQYNAGIESAMPFLEGLLRQYQADDEVRGPESALANFEDNRKRLLADMQGKLVGPNTPMFNPQVMSALQTITPEMLPGMLAASKYQSTQIKNAVDAARVRQLEQSKVTNLVAPDGTVVANVPGVGLVDTRTGGGWTGDASVLKPLVPTGRPAAEPRLPAGTVNLVDEEGVVVANIPGKGVVVVETGEAYTGDVTKLRPVPGAARAGAAGRTVQYTSSEGTFFSNETTGEITRLNADGTRSPAPALPADARRTGAATSAAAQTGTATLIGSDGNQYLLNRRTGATSRLNRDTGQYEDLPGGLPAGVTLFTPGSNAAAQAAARAQRVIISPEEAARISRITRTVKLNVPPFGQGEAGSNARNQFYKSLLADIDALGMGDTDAAIRMAMASASRKTRETIIQRDTTLRSEEDEAKVLLGKIEDELKAIGGPASPYLREKWNTVETRLFGNPTFTKLNLYMTQFVDTVGRLSSNATGAAGTPVAYLNFAKTVLDKDFNLDQIKAFRPAFDDLLNARRTGVKNAFEYLNELGAPLPAGGAAPAGRPGAAAPTTTADQDRARLQELNAAQAARDASIAEMESRLSGMGAAPAGAAPAGAAPARPAAPTTGRVSTAAKADILRQEYNSALERATRATEADQRGRALADARAARAELARLGVDVPEPGVPAQAVQPPADQADAIRAALRKANRAYEPDKFEYRVLPDGKVQERRKAP